MLKYLFPLLIIFIVSLQAEDNLIDPGAEPISNEDIPLECDWSKASECMDKVMLREHQERGMIRGNTYATFTAEIPLTWSTDDILKEAVRQSDASVSIDQNITSNLNDAIASNISLGAKSLGTNMNLSSAGASFGEYGRMLLLAFKQLLVEYKIESTLTQEAFSKSMRDEIVSLERSKTNEKK